MNEFQLTLTNQVTYLIGVAVFGLFSSFIFAPFIIGLLYKLKFKQIGKQEVDALIKNRQESIGTPVMGGLIIIIPLIIFYYLAHLHVRLGYGSLIVIVCGALLGFLNDYIDLKGKHSDNVEAHVYSKVNPLIYRNFTTWLMFTYFTAPFNFILNIVNSVSSYTTGLKASFKFLLQFIISLGALIVVHFTFLPLDKIWIPFWGDLILHPALLIGFYALIMVAFSNAFNVTDGLDAISPGNHLISYFLLGILAWILGYGSVAVLSFFIAGAELTFYYFNVPPARVEMSDVGTLPLGMLFALLFILINRVLISPIIGIVFFVEVLSSLLQGLYAKIFKRKLFKMAPIHHHFELLGWSREKIVMRSYFISLAFGLLGVLIALVL